MGNKGLESLYNRAVRGASRRLLPLVFAPGGAVRGFQAADFIGPTKQLVIPLSSGLSVLNLYDPVPGPSIVLKL